MTPINSRRPCGNRRGLAGHDFTERRSDSARDISAKGGVSAFSYLEVLDASFSFDGVIGAFALTHSLFLIGLGIGALYVRAMTIMLVERKTLAQFTYLEHGAFYSILALSVIMFAQTLVHIPEAVTGLIGGTLIVLALYSSIQYNRHAAAEHANNPESALDSGERPGPCDTSGPSRLDPRQ